MLPSRIGIITWMAQQRLYSVVTLYDCMQDPATVDWMAQANIALPAEIPPGRYPAPAEIRMVIESIPGLRLDTLISERAWTLTLRSRKDVAWVSLAVRDFNGDADSPHHFDFIAGWDEIVFLVASHLVKICGPLVLLDDSGAAPQVIM